MAYSDPDLERFGIPLGTRFGDGTTSNGCRDDLAIL